VATAPRLAIHGVRGSTPVAGPAFNRYGGHTTSFALTAPGASPVLIDAGSGLIEADAGASDYLVLFTHFHWDHISGLPFFAPMYAADARFAFLGRGAEGLSVEQALEGALRPPWFPIALHEMGAAKRFANLPPEEPLTAGPFTIAHTELQHPGGVTAYRITASGTSIVIATDVESGDPVFDERLIAFAAGADVLIHDAQYTPEEYEAKHRGWGHSTWRDATRAASAAGVRRLLLTSHDPRRTDDAVDAIVARARAAFPNTDAAHSGMSIAF
jgi:phosphoribosyl 1,2-cyclic phosphodiesterase